MGTARAAGLGWHASAHPPACGCTECLPLFAWRALCKLQAISRKTCASSAARTDTLESTRWGGAVWKQEGLSQPALQNSSAPGLWGRCASIPVRVWPSLNRGLQLAKMHSLFVETLDAVYEVRGLHAGQLQHCCLPERKVVAGLAGPSWGPCRTLTQPAPCALKTTRQPSPCLGAGLRPHCLPPVEGAGLGEEAVSGPVRRQHAHICRPGAEEERGAWARVEEAGRPSHPGLP